MIFWDVEIRDEFYQYNAYIRIFKVTEALQDFDIVLHDDKYNELSNSHCRTHNLAVDSDIATIMPGEGVGYLDAIRKRSVCLQRMHRLYRPLDVLKYALLFPRREISDMFEKGK